MRHSLSWLAKRALMMAVAPWVSTAIAQTNLGGVLDAGGRQLSADEFKREVVGKVMKGARVVPFGPTTAISGMGSVELVYLSAGAIRGSAQGAGISGGAAAAGASFAVEGSWTIDERERVCTTMRMGAVVLAPRCQFWYVQGKQYFVSDSDSDRSARISSYSIQP